MNATEKAVEGTQLKVGDFVRVPSGWSEVVAVDSKERRFRLRDSSSWNPQHVMYVGRMNELGLSILSALDARKGLVLDQAAIDGILSDSLSALHRKKSMNVHCPLCRSRVNYPAVEEKKATDDES